MNIHFRLIISIVLKVESIIWQEDINHTTHPAGMRREKEGEDMTIMMVSNQELFDKYNGKRGDIASEMCRRAGTVKYLQKYCVHDDKKFNSCMRDTIDVFKSILLKEDRKYAKY